MAVQLREARRRYPGFHPREHVFGTPNLEFTLTKIWAGIRAPARLEDLRLIVARWSPHLVIHENRELAGPIAAAEADLASANHGVGASFSLDTYRRMADATGPLWRGAGLEVGPLGGMFRYLYLDIFPPSMASHEVREMEVTQPVRPVPFDAVEHRQLPPWVTGLGRRPVVYVTQGTTFNHDVAVFATMLEALRDEPVDVVVTVGEDRDPAAVGPQPDNVHVERYVPQSLLFPHCGLVVSHGGGGTVLNALASACSSCPRVVTSSSPPSAPVRAVRLARWPSRSSPPSSCAERSNSCWARRARASMLGGLRDEIAGMPAPDDYVEVLERLARSRQAITRPPVRSWSPRP